MPRRACSPPHTTPTLTFEPGDLVNTETIGQLVAVSNTVPYARLHITSPSELRHDRHGRLRACYTVYVWTMQRAQHLPLMPPCTWCGLPTGNYCEACEAQDGPARPLCTQCEHDEFDLWANLCVFCRRVDETPEAQTHQLIGMNIYSPGSRRRGRRHP